MTVFLMDDRTDFHVTPLPYGLRYSCGLCVYVCTYGIRTYVHGIGLFMYGVVVDNDVGGGVIGFYWCVCIWKINFLKHVVYCCSLSGIGL